MRFTSEDGDGRFRLVLRYSSPDRFQITASDPFGRSLWSLYVARAEATLLDHRENEFCRFGEDLDLSSLYLGSFPVRSLPALLLGRLPVAPSGSARWSPEPRGGRRLDLRDGAGRRWRAVLDPSLRRWSVRDPGGELLAEQWRDEEWWILKDRRQRLELRWREVASEPLAGPVEAPAIPQRYREGSCR